MTAALVKAPPPLVAPQASGADTTRGQSEVLALQASLFQAQLELQAGQRAQRQAARTQEDLSRALQRLEKDLQGALQHRRETERHSQVRTGGMSFDLTGLDLEYKNL